MTPSSGKCRHSRWQSGLCLEHCRFAAKPKACLCSGCCNFLDTRHTACFSTASFSRAKAWLCLSDMGAAVLDWTDQWETSAALWELLRSRGVGGGGGARRFDASEPGREPTRESLLPGLEPTTELWNSAAGLSKPRLVRGSSLAKFNCFAFSGPRFWSLAEGIAASSCSTKHAAGGPGCGLGASLYTLFAVGVFHY